MSTVATIRPSRRAGIDEGSVLRALGRLALPIVFTTLLQNAYQLIDTFWLGRLGTDAMASVAISLPVTAVTTAMGIGLSVAGSTYVSQYTGRRDERMVGHVAGQTMLLVVGVAMAICVAGVIAAPSILLMLGARPAIFVDASHFLRLSFVGTAFAFTFSASQAIFRGRGEVRIPLLVVGGAVALNGVLAPMFIFGLGPVAPGGVVGAAVATLIAQGCAAVASLSLLFASRHGVEVIKADFVPDPPLLRRFLGTGLPASIEQSSGTLNYVVMTGLVASFGTRALATYGVGARIHFLMIVPTLSFAMATATLVGQSIGAGRPDRAVAAAKLSARVVFAIMCVVGIVMYFNAERVIRLFVPHDDALVAATRLYLKTGVFGLGVTAIHQTLAGAYRGAGATRTAMMLGLLYAGPIQLPLAYALSRPAVFGIQGLWIATPVANAIICAISLAVFTRGRWTLARVH